MIEQRQIPDPDVRSSILSAMSASLSEATATTTPSSDSVEQTDSNLEAPTSPTIAGATVPATTNAGDAPTTAAATPAPTTDALESTSRATLDADSSNSVGGLSQDARIGLGVGLGVGLALLLALVAILCLMRRSKRRQGQMGKYTPQAQSDLSMIEAPQAMAATRDRQLPEEQYKPSKHYDDVQDYQALEHPAHRDHHNVFETPVSAVAPSELQIPTQRNLPDAPPVLTIPETEQSPLHSAIPSPAHGHSPVSPVSMSPVSPIGSRPPSPKHGQ